MHAGMAAEAGLVHLLSRDLVEAADLRDIAATIDVGFARAVTAFAGHTFARMFKSEAGMRVRTEILLYVGMARSAGLLTDVARRIRSRLLWSRRSLLLADAQSHGQPGFCEPGKEQQTRHGSY
jgi:hypothetical protein